MKHPNLAQKLRLLYSLQINPKIKNNSDLARELDVSRQAVSRWCVGTQTTKGNKLPEYKASLIAKKFGIDVAWLSLPYEKFSEKVKKRKNSDEFVSDSFLKLNSSMLSKRLKKFSREMEIEYLNKH